MKKRGKGGNRREGGLGGQGMFGGCMGSKSMSTQNPKVSIKSQVGVMAKKLLNWGRVLNGGEGMYGRAFRVCLFIFFNFLN